MGRLARREIGRFLKSSGLNKLKVEKANELYRFTLKILVSLEGRKVAISIQKAQALGA